MDNEQNVSSSKLIINKFFENEILRHKIFEGHPVENHPPFPSIFHYGNAMCKAISLSVKKMMESYGQNLTLNSIK